MTRRKPILLLAATALALPSTAAAADPPGDLLAAATPLSDSVPPPSHAAPLSDVPIADAGMSEAAALLAANPEAAGELLAQAPPVIARPPPTLPRTGSELLITLLLGGGLALTGTGLRLRYAARAGAGAAGSAAGRVVAVHSGPATSTVGGAFVPAGGGSVSFRPASAGAR